MLDLEAFEPFLDEGLITDVVRIVKSGKEASVYLCLAGPSTGHEYLAAKVYHPRDRRSFHHDSTYKEGRVITKRRVRVAVEKKTRFGRQMDEMFWVHREHEVLTLLGGAGADVPAVISLGDRAILMEYLGDEEGPAPQLNRASLTSSEAAGAFDRLMANVELFLLHDLVHADLSPFNVLWWDDRPVIIDLPQAVDARTNPNAPELLARDLENLCRFFAKRGIERDGREIAGDLWTRYLFATL